MVDALLRDGVGGEDPERGGVAGRRGQRAARVGRQRQLHRGGRERPPGPLRVLVLQVYVQQRAGRLGVGRVRVVGAGQRELQAVLADRVFELAADQRRLGLDVESTEDERHRVAEAAEVGHADLEGGWRRRAPDAGDAHPVGALPRRA